VRATRFAGIGRIGQLAIAGRLTAGSSPKRSDGFQCHVASTLAGPLLILLEQHRADQTGDSVLIGKDADHFGPAVGLAVDAFERVVRVLPDRLTPMCGRETHVGEHVGLGLIQEAG
jgi:hypothetical protein